MPLSLIVGPPNSGKAGAIRARLEAALASDPLLVVPTLDDGDRFERELCEDAGERAVLGVSIRTFERLFDEVASATGLVPRPSLTEAQELCVIRAAIRRARPRLLARSAARPGFATALADLIGELQAACVDPATLAASAAATGQDSRYLHEIARLYEAYVAERNRLGYGDSHEVAARATAALRRDPDAWSGRPVLLYGFDDLTVEQLELVDALAAAAPITVAVGFEDRAALVARADLLGELRERGGRIEATLEPDPANTASATLFHLERSFLREEAGRVEPDGGLRLLEAAGERGQAEQIGAEIARLLADGTEPDEIAVALRDPDRHGPLYADVLDGLGIPAAVEARVPLARTASGRGVLALLRAALGPRQAEDVLGFVRTPGVALPRDADWLERAIRRRGLRSATEALGEWRGRELFEIEELGRLRGRDLLTAIARFARRIAERPHLREAPLVPAGRRIELRAASAAAEALEEIAELPEADVADALATLEAIAVPLWRGPADGHVRVTSPYRLRARRMRHLFVTALQEGEFPRPDAGEPFLSDEQRAALSLPKRADPLDEERYLFAVCLSRPTHRLHLSWRSCDDEGAEASPSPFLDDVRDLLAPAPPLEGADPLASRIARRHLGEVTFRVDQAPSGDELARSLAPLGVVNGDGALAGLGLEPADADRLRRRLADARERLATIQRRLADDRLPDGDRGEGWLTLGPVLAELEARDLYGASTLEEYALCSYRWFVQHELRPEALEPEPDARAQGTVVHAALEELYREPPGGDPLPRPETLASWRRRARELVAEHAAEHGLGGDDPRAVVARARMTALVGGFLEREAAASVTSRLEPALFEASFGAAEEDERPPLPLGDFGLHGQIDRVDVPVGGEPAGLVRDYKLVRQVTLGKNLESEGKLQPQLYALALERLWGRRALGGLYQPLAATKDHAPRGIARKAEADGALAGLGLIGGDLLGDEEFEGKLAAAEERARKIVAEIRAGRIRRDPRDDECPRYCTFQAICRRERAARIELEPAEEGEEEE